jgi:hypothetical protein
MMNEKYWIKEELPNLAKGINLTNRATIERAGYNVDELLAEGKIEPWKKND